VVQDLWFRIHGSGLVVQDSYHGSERKVHGRYCTMAASPSPKGSLAMSVESAKMSIESSPPGV
jgi:hypothetical protein